MRQVLRGLAVGVVVACHVPAAHAQQGTVQVSGAVQNVSSGSRDLTGENAVDPDVGLSWLQPGVRFGSVQLDLRAVKRTDQAHLGRAYAALRDVKSGSVSWTLEAGDAYFTRAVGGYGFSNLTTPAVTFSGAAISARTARGLLNVVGGRATAWRNIFGTDPDTMGQALGLVRGAYKPSERVEVLGRVSRIRTSDLGEFSFSVADSRQAGGGVRVAVVPALQLVADASLVDYRRVGSIVSVRDGSYLAGASLLLGKGWIQLNAARFSPGEFPTMNDPLHDRETAFGAGEYDLGSRVRVFGGLENLRTNIDPDETLPAPLPRTTATRGFGGLRLLLGPSSAITLRVEEGDRIARPLRGGFDSESDTGARSAEWLALLGPVTAYTRYARRQNVDRRIDASSFTQDDLATQLFFNVSRTTQLFTLATRAHHEDGSGQSSSYWQVGGGAQLQMASKNLWLRGEGSASRNMDSSTREFVPRESLNLGVNGQLTGGMAFAFTIAGDRMPFAAGAGSPWTLRSTLRVVQSFSTGTARVVPAGGFASAASRSRGTGQITGLVYVDWNGNATQDAGEPPLENIPVRVPALSAATTGRNGEFAFLNVPAGPQQVGLDTSALPVDFDPPAISVVDVELDRGTSRRVSFGLIPLGTVRGRVMHDVNANGRIDPGEPSIDGAVLVLDQGARSEQVRKGAYRFEAIRSGDHVVRLLGESLPDGATMTGLSEVPFTLSRHQLAADIDFVVVVQKRPETRKVFPPRGGAQRAPSPATTPEAAKTTARAAMPRNTPSAPSIERPSTPVDVAPPPRPADMTRRFAVQVGAFSDPARAQAAARDLAGAGYTAHVLEPRTTDPRPLYRVRVGGYPSREAASAAAAALSRLTLAAPAVLPE